MSVSINPNNIIGNNKLTFGTQFDWANWNEFLTKTTLRELTQAANLKLVRVFDFRNTTPAYKPCTNWNDSTKTGTWNWTNVDAINTSLFNIGAEPLWCLGGVTQASGMANRVPSGMAINPSTQLPDPSSWAAYCREWVRHFQSINAPVRFYEIVNEPWMWFGWLDTTKFNNFKTLVNAAMNSMRQQNPNVLLGFDGLDRNTVLDTWLSSGGADLGFMSFHKYDSGALGEYTDAQMLNRAETFMLVSSGSYYGVRDMKQRYFNARGTQIPVINSESNLNSYTETGTDPRIQQIVGAVWWALVLKTSIEQGLDYNIYFHLDSSKSYETTKGSGGWGFGMINADDNQPWFPYWLHKIISPNLAVNDEILQSSTANSNLRVLAWKNSNRLNILLINKSNTDITATLSGISGNFNYWLLDNSITASSPTPKQGTTTTQTIRLNGYSVALLQQAQPVVVKYVFANWNNNPSEANPTITVTV